MSDHGERRRGAVTGEERSKESRDSQRQADGTSVVVIKASMDAEDLHPFWLKEWRSLRHGSADGGKGGAEAEEAARRLQNRIAQTPAHTLSGMQAQVELISELAWNDVVATTARQLLSGIKRLRKTTMR